jgi:hypothetical protein
VSRKPWRSTEIRRCRSRRRSGAKVLSLAVISQSYGRRDPPNLIALSANRFAVRLEQLLAGCAVHFAERPQD